MELDWKTIDWGNKGIASNVKENICRTKDHKNTTNSTMGRLTAWQEEYKRLWLVDHEKKYPNYYLSAPQIFCYLKWPKVKTANGLTKAIIDFLTWKGHFANRINTQGRMVVQKVPRYSLASGKIEYSDKVKWQKGTTKKGTPDIQAVINSKAVFIEIKIGHDIMSEWQLKRKAEIEAAGGIFYKAQTMEGFYDWYNTTFGENGQN